MKQAAICTEIRETLLAQQDEEYRLFQAKLMPDVAPERIIGVRTPVLRKLAKEYAKREDIAPFLQQLPHDYYDEYNLHGFIISHCKSYDKTIGYIDAFLPYVDNWATCDSLSPTVFKKHTADLSADIDRWLASGHVYTIRFGIGMLMRYFLDEHFDVKYADKVAAIRSDEYYINMMIAWYFATALAKQWESILPYLTEQRLDVWTHNKTIQKAVESYRITDGQKTLLRKLRRKK